MVQDPRHSMPSASPAPWQLSLDVQGGSLTLSDLSITGSIVGSSTEPLIKVGNFVNMLLLGARLQGVSGSGSSLLQLEPVGPLSSISITGCICSNIQLQSDASALGPPGQPENGVCVDVHAAADVGVSVSVASSLFQGVQGPGAALAVQVCEGLHRYDAGRTWDSYAVSCQIMLARHDGLL